MPNRLESVYKAQQVFIASYIPNWSNLKNNIKKH